jgi:hypothetical protein
LVETEESVKTAVLKSPTFAEEMVLDQPDQGFKMVDKVVILRLCQRLEFMYLFSSAQPASYKMDSRFF